MTRIFLKNEFESSCGLISCFFNEHSFILANLRHRSNGIIYPQFHLVFDSLFETARESMTVQLKIYAVIFLV